MTALKGLLAAAVLTAAAATAAPAFAQTTPSFNCKRARTFVEKAICQNPSLAAKDRRMSRLYFDLRARLRDEGYPQDARELQDSQRTWLARRDRCQTMGCLTRAYDDRIFHLQKQSN